MNNEKVIPVDYDEHRKETSRLCLEVGFPAYHLRFFVVRETETDTKTPTPPLTPKQITLEQSK